MLMIFTISSPVTKDLTKKKIYNLAIKAFKTTLDTWISTHIYNDEYSIAIDCNDEKTNSCYIDLDTTYFRTNLNLITFKKIIKSELNLLFKDEDESNN